MYKAFSFNVSGEINFGIGCLKELPSKIIARNLKKVLIFSDPFMEKPRLVIEKLLSEQGIKYIHFTDIEPNPSSAIIAKGAKVFADNNIDGIVCLGGGSTMDTAKGVAVVGSNGGKIEDYSGVEKVKKNSVVPIIAIPTTAGTGSEVTRFAVITDSQHFKMIINSHEILPECVLLDPELITTVPAALAASTGADALTHAVEAYLSLTSSPFSDIIAEKAIELIGAYLRLFVANRGNIEAASGMLLGSTLAGIALSLARPGNVHALSHALSGLHEIPHGIANAVLFPVVLEFNALADNGKYQKIYSLIKPGKSVADFSCDMLVSEIRKLNQDVGIPQNLSELGITKDHIPALVTDTMESTLFQINPRQTTKEDVAQLYLNAL